MSWESLGSFVSTPSGKAVWNKVDLERTVDVVILGLTVSDEMANVLCKLLQALVTHGQVRVLKGGWAAVMNTPEAMDRLVSGENDKRASVSLRGTAGSPPQSAPVSNAPIPPPVPPSEPLPSSLSHHPSLPSLRTADSTRARRGVDQSACDPRSPLCVRKQSTGQFGSLTSQSSLGLRDLIGWLGRTGTQAGNPSSSSNAFNAAPGGSSLLWELVR